MSSKDTFGKIQEVYGQFLKEANAHIDKNCKSCARRARTASSKLDKLLKEYRKETVEEEKKKG
jgi:phosphohistidine phosphatase SixA